jgi:putative NADH-flavin reductase
MSPNDRKLIAVIGATGQQGGGVVRALQASGQLKVRALSRNPVAEMLSYFQAHTYLGSDSHDRIALANKIAGRQPTNFSAWARVNFPVKAT